MQRHHYQLSILVTLLLYLAVTAAWVQAGGRQNSGTVVFVKETIAVSISADDTVQVRGTYWFCGADSSISETRLYYPFPLDTFSDYPVFIEVQDASSSRVIPFTKQESGIMFYITLKPPDTASVMVLYRQSVRNREGRYILTTTANWGRPLIDSKYSVSIPAKFTLEYMSYECDSISGNGTFLLYSFFKKSFMPDRDLCFRWKANDAFKKSR